MAAPLVPVDVDLRDFEFMPLDVNRLRDSKFAKSVKPEEFRAGVLLWCAAWHQVPGGSLPDDDIELAGLAGYGYATKEWRRVKQGALYGWVKADDGRLYHATLAEKALESWTSKLHHAHGKFCDRLRKENKVRAEKSLPAFPIPSFDMWQSAGKPADFPQETKIIPAEKLEIPPETGPPSDGIPPEKSLKGEVREHKGQVVQKLGAANAPPAEPVKRAKRLAPDWTLPDDWKAWALAEFPEWTEAHVIGVSFVFRDHWHGKGTSRLDWLATWRNWVRNPLSAPRERGPPAGNRQTLAERRTATMDTITGRTNGRDITGTAERVDQTPVRPLPIDVRQSDGDDVGSGRPR